MIALSDKARSEKIRVVESLNLQEKKTKIFAGMVKGLDLSKSILVSFSKEEKNCYKAARNVEKVNTMEVEQLNVFDLMNSEYLIVSKDSIKQIKDKYIS